MDLKFILRFHGIGTSPDWWTRINRPIIQSLTKPRCLELWYHTIPWYFLKYPPLRVTSGDIFSKIDIEPPKMPPAFHEITLNLLALWLIGGS